MPKARRDRRRNNAPGRIDNSAMNDTSTAPTASPSSPSRRVSSWWRALAIALLLVLLVIGASGVSMFEQFKAQVRHLQDQVSAQPQIRQIAVLLDEQQKPALLVTVDPNSGVLQLERLNEVREGPDQSLELWALDGERTPRSLGVIASKVQTPQLPLDPTALAGATALAVSVENKGGAEGRRPNPPWLFRGWLVQKAI